jgi:hypothetical protein
MLIPATPLRIVTPVEQSIILLVPAIAACALASWFRGGRAGLAILWIALAAWTLSRPTAGTSAGFDQLARGWSIVAAACFGIVSCLETTRPFFGRAMSAIAAAAGLVALIVVVRGPGELRETVESEVTTRSARTVSGFDALPGVSSVIARDSALARGATFIRESTYALGRRAVVVFPALVALETLVVLTLAWTLFHRLSRVRLGPPLARLREFRFDDRLVWGVLIGGTAAFLPTLDPFRDTGWNLMVFFGGLHAARGLGVLAWFLSPGRFALATMVILAVLTGPMLAILTFGIGIGDTWVDWRNRVRAST